MPKILRNLILATQSADRVRTATSVVFNLRHNLYEHYPSRIPLAQYSVFNICWCFLLLFLVFVTNSSYTDHKLFHGTFTVVCAEDWLVGDWDRLRSIGESNQSHQTALFVAKVAEMFLSGTDKRYIHLLQ